MILGFVHYTHIICHEWPSCDKGGKGKKAEQVVNFVIFLSGTDANTYADKSMNIFQGRICTDCCIRMLRKLGSWGGDQVVPVFERKGCDNKETVFETVADVITEHVKQWIFVSKKYYQR